MILYKCDSMIKEPSLDEMWQEIEKVGIKRKLLEMRQPTYEEIKELYKTIKGRQETTHSIS